MTATCLGDELDPDGDRRLAAFVDDVHRSYAAGPPPRVGPALAGVLAAGTGVVPAPTAPAAVDRTRPAEGFVAWLSGRRPRMALGAAVASLTFLGTGAAGALPGPAQAAFERTADAVGVRLPQTGAREPTAPVVPRPGPSAGPTSDARQEHGPEVPSPAGSVPPGPGAAGPAASPEANGREGPEPGAADRRPGEGVPGGGTGGRSGPGAPDVPASGRPGPSRPGAGADAPRASAGTSADPAAAGAAPAAGLRRGPAWHWRPWSPPPPPAGEGGPEGAPERRGSAAAGEMSSRPYPSTPPGR